MAPRKKPKPVLRKGGLEAFKHCIHKSLESNIQMLINIIEVFIYLFLLLPGRLYFLINLESRPLTMLVSDLKVNDGETHELSLRLTGTTGLIRLDGKELHYAVSVSKRSELIYSGTIFIGSFPNGLNNNFISAPGLIGCMQNVWLNDERVNLVGLVRDHEVDGIAGYCKQHVPRCSTHPCMHNGVCQERWNRFVCDCSATPYRGPYCMQGWSLSLVTFWFVC